ncbi:polysaccharide biosynthesis protein [Lachnospiraceae bacterium 62-35]
MNLSSQKRAFLAGTLLLTFTGFLCRILGFFYRIFLSRTIGAEGLGLYNMVHPIFGICFALCAGSIQTAISQCVAANARKGKSIFLAGLTISLSMAGLLALLIWNLADFLAIRVLLEQRCAPLLPYIAISVPCSAIHACINGYYYGMQKTRVPAFSQLAEQAVRIGAVFLIADIMMEKGITITVQLAVIGHLIGEAASSLYTLLAFCLCRPKARIAAQAALEPQGDGRLAGDILGTRDSRSSAESSLTGQTAFSVSPGYSGKNRYSRQQGAIAEAAAPLMALALPLMGNRLILNILASAEAIWIPSRLQIFGLSSSDALNIYGVLTGMALPFILFPSAITNSIAVLLLPTVARAQAEGNRKRISSTISMSIRYSLYMGILCVGIFTIYGAGLGSSVFHNGNAGDFIIILAWLCPFLYLSTTTGSILNGLGKTTTTFVQNVLALIFRLGFVFFGIPRYGILALLWGMLASELFLSLLHLISLKQCVPFAWHAGNMILKPAILLAISAGITQFIFFSGILPVISALPEQLPPFLSICVQVFVLSGIYGGLLFLFHKKRRQPHRIH